MIFLSSHRLVLTSDDVDETMHRFVPIEPFLEAGGLLIGEYRGPHVEVVKCTTPFAGDFRSRSRFVRQDPRHQSIATAEWTASGGTLNYVGEWHTHPELHPTPSHIDRRSWVDKIRSRTPLPLVFLIAGAASVHCTLSEGERMKTSLRVA